MGTQSFPRHLRGRAATSADAEAKGTDIDFATDRAAEVAAELGLEAADLEGVVGTGKDRALTVADVKEAAKE